MGDGTGWECHAGWTREDQGDCVWYLHFEWLLLLPALHVNPSQVPGDKTRKAADMSLTGQHLSVVMLA